MLLQAFLPTKGLLGTVMAIHSFPLLLSKALLLLPRQSQLRFKEDQQVAQVEASDARHPAYKPNLRES